MFKAIESETDPAGNCDFQLLILPWVCLVPFPR